MSSAVLGLTYKTTGCPVDCLFALFHYNLLHLPASLPLLPSKPSPPSHWLCDITVWLWQDGKKPSALETQWMWLQTHLPANAHVPPTHFLRSCVAWACNYLQSDQLLLTHKRTQTAMRCFVGCSNAWLRPSRGGQLIFLPGSAPYWGWKEWLKAGGFFIIYYQQCAYNELTHGPDLTSATVLISHNWYRRSQETGRNVFGRKDTPVCPQLHNT